MVEVFPKDTADFHDVKLDITYTDDGAVSADYNIDEGGTVLKKGWE